MTLRRIVTVCALVVWVAPGAQADPQTRAVKDEASQAALSGAPWTDAEDALRVSMSRELARLESRPSDWSEALGALVTSRMTGDWQRRALRRRLEDAIAVGDVTFLATPNGWTYLAVLIDLFSRKVVGWATSETNNTALALAALNMAAHHRQPKPGLIHHTDRGAPYASSDYQERLSALGATASMSRKGNCYDNAVSESFFGTLKAALGERFESHCDAHNRLFEFIEVFYDGIRHHFVLGYRSPRAFERLES